MTHVTKNDDDDDDDGYRFLLGECVVEHKPFHHIIMLGDSEDHTRPRLIARGRGDLVDYRHKLYIFISIFSVIFCKLC